MCDPTTATTTNSQFGGKRQRKDESSLEQHHQRQKPSLVGRYASAFVMITIFSLWGYVAFYYHGRHNNSNSVRYYYDESKAPGIGSEVHNWKFPFSLTLLYITSLPLLRLFSANILTPYVGDVKLLLRETMIVYNAGQVLLNGWMFYRLLESLWNESHPFIGDIYTVNSGTTFVVWIHYMDKYLEFFDTFFMILRGRMDQVSFLHIYHHISIAWAWWFAMISFPGGDAYFGALLNSWIHVMMYSYYTLSLLKFNCPWKRYLTKAQLIQFVSVVVYTAFSFGILHGTGELLPQHKACYYVQIFEMISLFFLFARFYSKTYKKKKKR